ncbi:MAG: glycosyltransferase family 2 protein [Nanoarchaeota archaeon]|nr:glycosyltransferase family 2 protein [Nanoarchaeota archaeon]MBU1320865.1 glycosyltransferase family 2 protein [Nanoarchaeota archaeon]MBU1597771.1 glycosyltransferase family 2 protein [Nanoarchaeota archaeon]MBU2441222.1 glycosyltransferase family 2 protein [Nanoarchaeota archaeon]
MKKSITVVVAAYNEEGYLERAIKKYVNALNKTPLDYEILIINDGSKDRTDEIANQLAKKYPQVRVSHNKRNRNLGYVFRKAVRLAKKNYITLFPGEGELLASSIRKNLSYIGKADIIVPHIGNPKLRPFYRRVISSGFTTLLNLLFGLHLKYYNGHVINKVKVLRKTRMTTDSFAYEAEILIRLLKGKKKYSYIQVPYYTEKRTGKSAALKIKNLIMVCWTVIRLLRDIRSEKNDS